MSWLDEELARQNAARARQPEPEQDAAALDRDARAKSQVQALDPLVQLLLSEYGQRAMGKTFRGRQYGTLLESPGQRNLGHGEIERWDWHWHLHSYVRGVPGLEVHPQFDEQGVIIALDVRSSSAVWDEVAAPTEDALKAALVHAYLAIHGTPRGEERR